MNCPILGVWQQVKIISYSYHVVLLAIIVSLFAFQNPAIAVSAEGPSDKAELEHFLDSVIIEQMQKNRIPGAVLSVVKDGNLYLEKGYGLADVDKKTPVDPRTTVFRVGSISKLFTTTAVMQLVERGSIDLDEDVNGYLGDFKIINKYSQPVTMYNILTHTAGFDDRWTGVAAQHYSNVSSLGEYLNNNMPQIIRQPGTITQYSNHGMALAGYIVEEVSGMSFEDYIIQNIMAPLEMNHSFPRITQQMVADLALEYTYKNGAYKSMQLYDFNIYPAGSICSTASDMAKFMIAHLNNGTYSGVSILKKETAQQMHSQQFSNSSQLPGMCFGFYEIIEDKHRFIAHAGDTNGSHSIMLLDPEQNIGLFVSTNGVQGQILINEITNQFIKHYYSSDHMPVFTHSYGKLDNQEELEGEYRNVRYARNTLDKLVLLLTPQASIKAEDDSLTLKSPFGDGRYIQVEPLLFRNMENGRYLSFRTEGSRNPSYMFNENPTSAFEKVQWYQSNKLHIILLIFCIVMSLTWCIYCAMKYLRRSDKITSPAGRYAESLLTIIAISSIVSLAGIFAAILSMDSVLDIGFKLPVIMRVVLAGQIAVAVLTGILAVIIFIVWQKAYWRMPGRLYFTLVGVANICFTAILYYYNMIGIKY